MPPFATHRPFPTDALRTLGSGLAAAALALPALGQLEKRLPPDLPIQDSLYRVYEARHLDLAELRALTPHGARTLNDQRELHVVLQAPAGEAAVPDALVESFGGRADTRWRHQLDAWVPLDRLAELARALPPGHRVVRAFMAVFDDQGPDLMGSDTYRDGGAAGQGMKIGIVDGGFQGLTGASQAGAAPPGWFQLDYTGSGIETTTPHGTACVETAYDHCPGAEFWVFKIDSSADLGSAVEAAIDNGVDVLSHSVTWFNTGWWDNQGAPCEAALEAATNGILFVTSAGNQALRHWQGTYDAVDTSWHDWSGTGDRDLAVTVPAQSQLHLYLQWNANAGSIEDYDLYLYSTFGNQIASSANLAELPEDLVWTNDSATPTVVNVRVRRALGNTTELELFGTVDGGSPTFEYFTASSSTASPSNTEHYNVLSVGAVPQLFYAAGNGTSGIVASYSSRGPTNSGASVPDLVAPTQTSTVTYGTFDGTSCSAPNLAGALVALRDSIPVYEPHAIQWLPREHARLVKDWGAPGTDPVYGVGGAFLAPYVPSTVWLARSYGNVEELQSRPSYTLDGAQGWVPPGGRILALGGGPYPEPAVLDFPHVLDAYAGTAVFGQ